MRSTRRAAWRLLPLARCSARRRSGLRRRDRIAVFDPELLDTSGEGDRPDQQRRLAMIGQELRQALAASGRYVVVDVAPQRARLAEGPALRGCGPCAAEAAEALGAELALVTVVQKVSNLILSITLSVLEAVAVRGPPRGLQRRDPRQHRRKLAARLRWLLRNRLLAGPDRRTCRGDGRHAVISAPPGRR